MYVGWTDERIEKLKTLWATGAPASQIASELGGFDHCPDGGRSSVLGKVHRLKLPLRSATVVSLNKRRAYQKPMKSRRAHFRKDDAQASAARAADAQKRKSSPVRALFRDIPIEPLPPVEELHIPLNERKSIATLEANDCRWPIGDPRDADFHFCGKHQVAGLPYCEHHARRAYAPIATAQSKLEYRSKSQFGVGTARFTGRHREKIVT